MARLNGGQPARFFTGRLAVDRFSAGLRLVDVGLLADRFAEAGFLGLATGPPPESEVGDEDRAMPAARLATDFVDGGGAWFASSESAADSSP